MDGPNVLQGASHVNISGGTIIATNEMVILNQYGSHRSPHVVQKACAAISFAGQQYQLVKGNKERCKILIQRCTNILIPVCKQIQSEGLPDSMLDNILVLENVCISVRDIVTKLASQSFAWRLLNQDKTDGDMKAIENKLLDAISVFNISAHADGMRLQREFADSLAEAAAKDQSELVAYLDNLSQNDHMILHSLRENHLRMEELLVALTKHVQAAQSNVTTSTTPSEKFIRHAVGALQRLSKEPAANLSDWQLTSLEVTFNRDDLESQIGQGSFGTVFKGQWQGEVVAVKEMYIEDARNIDRNLLKTLHNEIAIWSKLTHPRVVQFYGACLEATRPFMVSRFCLNGNVIEYLRKNPTKNRLELLHQVSLGMAFLHSQSVIHADLKGANILIEGEGNALLSDFGISQLKDHTGTSSLNRTGMEKTRGTLRWMAPELLFGEKLDFPADVYTFGITAWELYTLDIPFSNVPERALHYRIIDKRERPTCPPTMDSGLIDLVVQCWAHDAVGRPTFKNISVSISTIVTNAHRELTIKAIADEGKRKRQERGNVELEQVIAAKEKDEKETRRGRIEEIEEKEEKHSKEIFAMPRQENRIMVRKDQAANDQTSVETIKEKGNSIIEGHGQNDKAANDVDTQQGGSGTAPDAMDVKKHTVQPSPSSSSGARATTAKPVLEVVEQPEVEVKGHMNESNAIPLNTNAHQQPFGGNPNPTRYLKSPMLPLSVMKRPKEKDKSSIQNQHAREEKSVHESKTDSDSLSSLFGGASGRGEKKPPTSISPSTSLSEVPKEHMQGYNGKMLQNPTTSSHTNIASAFRVSSARSGEVIQGQGILDQIGEPDHAGWMRKKGDYMNIWTLRYFVLKGPHLYCLKNNKKTETKLKGYIHVLGYRAIADENVDPGRYGFKLVHDSEKIHQFSSEEKTVIREWVRAITKATIGRDYSRPVVSSANQSTIPVIVAQAMNPRPQPHDDHKDEMDDVKPTEDSLNEWATYYQGT